MKKLFKITVGIALLLSLQNIYAGPYVILVSFDGFRWDYLNRRITPTLLDISTKGTRALSLRPSFPSKTFPNHYSIVTGMYPENHGIIANNFIDPQTGERYNISDTVSKWDEKWYMGEAFWETAEKNGLKSASIFWPGSEIRGAGKHPEYFKYYNSRMPYTDRIDTLLAWLTLPSSNRPHFLSLYFEYTDTYGHRFGPNSSEVNEAIRKSDSAAAYLVKRLTEISMIDSVDLIIVSDHGMTETSPERIINVEEILEGYNCDLYDSGPVMRVHPSAGDVKKVYEHLKGNASHFKVYTKDNIPSFYHYSKGLLTPPITVIADPGWSLLDNKGIDRSAKYFSGGNHGYEKDFLDMNGIFIASGPSFKSCYQTGTLWNIDIYPLLAKLFDIKPNKNIDGNLERIEFILKGR